MIGSNIMNVPRLAVAIVIWLCALTEVWATSYYYVYDNGVFYIGADTLMSVMPAMNSESSGRKAAFHYEHGCKMVVNNTLVVTPLGWDGEMLFLPDKDGHLVKPVGLVPLYAHIRDILSTTHDPDIASNELLRAGEQTSTDLFAYRRKLGARDVASPDISLSIFYWREGAIYNRVLTIKSTLRNHEQVVVSSSSRPHALVPGNVEGYGLLDAMLIPPTAAERRLFHSTADIIPYNLSKQSEMTPDAVGPPFTIFKLSPAGGVWSSHGEMCKKNSFLK
jgi:hypothetical protein